ncbi:MAG: RagB/SusD family nutrient uptake outer membrane protein [bacterium]
MKMKIIRKIVIFSCFIISGSSCSEDFLTKSDPSSVSVEDFYETERDFMMALAGTYNVLLRGDYNNMSFWKYHETVSDDAHPGDDPEFVSLQGYDLDNFTVRPDNLVPLNIFASSYIGIARSNITMTRALSSDLNEGFVNQIVAETRFLRALFYFNLVRCFGDVPLIMKEVTDPDLVAVPRTDKNKIYDELIIPDLQYAIDILPAIRSGDNLARATSGAARALLAKVYLTRGEEDKSNYQKARDMALEVINSNTYSLEENYEDIFKRENEFGQEMIFEINHISGQEGYEREGFGQGNSQPKRNGLGSFYNNAFAPRFKGPARVGDSLGLFSFGGWGLVVPTTSNDPRDSMFNVPEGTGLVEAFEEGDLRKDVTILNYYEAAAEKGVPVDRSISPYNANKYDDWEESENGEADDNYIILRLADIYLMYAEAENEINGGPTPEALEYLNKVRRRAYGYNIEEPSVVDYGNLDYKEFLDAVYKERRLELAYEGHRWFDLIRRPQRAIKVMKAHGKTGITTNKLVLPIPQYIIDESEGLITQNEGYY